MSKRIVAALLCLGAVAGPARAQGIVYEVEPHHTFVTFEVVHNGTSTTRGRFDTVTGSVMLDPAAGTGRADIQIETASVNSGSKPFDEHLRNKDFFDVTAFPRASFQGSAFTFEAGKVVRVAGTLTLLGVAHDVVLEARRFNCYQNPRSKRDTCGGDFETTIARSKWGMGFGLPGIPDSVRLVVQIEAVRP
ncbi:MAG: YceI family protein [Burkholderiaceae bacterium]|nr:YceI family protein [Burkholderiaceae bacterium]MEB2351666.1 YceI family protein [Burkholderiaceae bacterium]